MPVKLKCTRSDCGWVMDQEMEMADARWYVELHIKTEHPIITQAAANNRREKMKRPSAELDMSESKWRDFINQWGIYKRTSGVTGQDIVDDLWQCLSDPLRMEVTSEQGADLETAEEEDLLSAIKKMAVLESNPMVHRNNLRTMLQGESEKIRNYVARLREAAIDCQFNVKCSEELCEGVNSYKEEIIRDQCVSGLRCRETQGKILALGTGLPTLDAVIAKAEAEEQATLAQNKLVARSIKQEAAVEVSSLASDKGGEKGDKCRFCDRSGHGKNPDTKTRKKSCPAFGKSCFKCEKTHHFSSVCKGKKSEEDAAKTNAITAASDKEEILPATFFAINADGQKALDVGHIDWDSEVQHWVQRKPRAMKQMRVDIRVLVEDHRAWHPRDNFKKSWPVQGSNPGKIFQIKSTPDTGAQVTCSGTHLLQKLNMSQRDLIPTSQTIVAANNKSLLTLGGVMIEVTGSKNGIRKTTKQFCYICKEVTGLYLSRSACGDLAGVLPWTEDILGVNSIGSAVGLDHEEGEVHQADDGTESQRAPCGCPARSAPPPLPTEMPFGEEEVDKLQDWLLKRYAGSAFNVCTHQKLNKMTGPPLELKVDPTVTPVARHVPAPIPWHFKEQVKAGLEADTRMGVIEEVPANTSVSWMSRMVITPKKNGTPRRTVDYFQLNKACKRQTHHTRSPYHLATDIPKNVKKSCYDAWNGFHSVPLAEDSKQYTKFITPWGAYQYCVCPQGWLSAQDAYSKRYDGIIKEVKDYVKCIDDVCQWDETVEGCFWKACKFLELCSKNGITFNPEKFVFARDEVEYIGFEITADSVRPGQSMIQAISDFPAPTNITGMRSFFGLVNQVSYAFSMKETMAPFRELLRPSSTFYWDDKLQALFEEARLEIVKKVEKGVKMFEMGRVTCVAPDWSKEGVGFFLFQKHCDCVDIKLGCCKDGWQITMAGSRFLRPNEKNWYPGEGEALGVVYALNKTKHFVLGCKQLYVATDHKPLLGTFGDRDLEQIENPRLRRLLYVPAKTHCPGTQYARRA